MGLPLGRDGPGRLAPRLLLGPPGHPGLPGADEDVGHQQEEEARRDRQRRPVLARELPQPVAGRRRARLHRLVVQVALDVPGQPAGRLVPPRPVLLQALHHDPVELAAHQLRQPRRLGLPRRRDLRQVARAA